MNSYRSCLVAIVLALPALALAQWQWVDKDGRKVFSDQPPPPDVPAANIVKQPGVRAAAPAPAPAPAAATAAAASAPKLSGKDKTLDEKKKLAEAQASEKKKQEEAQQEAARTENCARAKKAKALYDSGMRVATVNSKGEREILDDAQRAAEIKRIDAVIASDCGPQRQ
jgi:hypothetical protein